MPENELFDEKPKEEPKVEEPVVLEVTPDPVKPAKKKRVISDKQRAQLAENLKRGRETSLKNRRAKKAANAAAKSGKIVAAAPSIDHSTDIKQLREEVSSIKKDRAFEKEQKRLRKLEKEELKKKKELEKEVKPVPEPAAKPDLKPEPVVVPVKPKAKVLSSRELMKLMDRL
tara:strand:- start:177 stop:692 length:516 start_codon:yes stop_codon:yes gene_type:complete